MIARLNPDSPLQCRVIPVTHVRQNCSVIWCRATGRGAVIDPGGELERIAAVIEEGHVTVERLLITHSHPDHSGGAAALAARLGVPVEGPHRAEAAVIAPDTERARARGFADASPLATDRWLADGETIAIGHCTLQVLHCPGHTPGHVTYFCPQARLAFVGDILFKDAIGWTGTPEDTRTLLHSIRRRLFPLGDDVVFVPGHVELSTFGEERFLNPFVSDLAAEDYDHMLDELGG